MRKKILVVGLIIILVVSLSASYLYRGVTSQAYGVIASSFAEGSDAQGINPANLFDSQKEFALSFNQWLGGVYLANLFFSYPTLQLNKIKVVNAFNGGFFSTGKYSQRDSDGTLLSTAENRQFIVSSINSVVLNKIKLGVGINYFNINRDSISEPNLTIDFGVHYLTTINTLFDFVGAVAVNNFLAKNSNTVGPFNMNASAGIIYYAGNSAIGFSFGTSYYEVAYIGGIGGYYKTKAGISDSVNFNLIFYASYNKFLNHTVLSIGNFAGIKTGLSLLFGYFNIDYSFQYMGYAGAVNSVGLRFFL